ncbi:hypothetical protein [Streptomyces barkulensis]|uniref:hypothetical protein n=1 Tax=Streptomyces barkulensis TaxID=1257026 RepID=UPI001F4E6870|nr:hypothetical protein [Streptomyces barkulensis]
MEFDGRVGGVTVELSDGTGGRFDAVVLAGGGHLGDLGRRFGVRRVVQASRGHSFSVPVEPAPAGRSTSPPSGWPAHRWGTGCGWRG